LCPLPNREGGEERGKWEAKPPWRKRLSQDKRASGEFFNKAIEVRYD
jgi:hypothetical protein